MGRSDGDTVRELVPSQRITYDSASRQGGTYIVALGPIIVGAIRIFRGLARLGG